MNFRSLKNWTIAKKLTAVFLAFTAVAVLCTSTLYSALKAYDETITKDIATAKKAQDLVGKARHANTMMGWEMALYVMTGKVEHKTAKLKADDDFGAYTEQALAEIKKIPGSGKVIKAVEGVEAADEQYCHHAEEAVTDLMDKGDTPGALKSYQGPYMAGRAKFGEAFAIFEKSLNGLYTEHVKEATATAAKAQKLGTFLVIFMIVSGIFIARWFGTYIKNSISKMKPDFVDPVRDSIGSLTLAIQALEQGNLTYKPEFQPVDTSRVTQDEIGLIAGDLVETSASAEMAISSFIASQNALSQLIGNVQQQAGNVASFSEELVATADTTARDADNISENITGVMTATNEMALTAEKMAHASSDLAHNAGQSSTMMHELGKVISDVQRSTEQQRKAASEATTTAEQGGVSVQKAISLMSNIETKVHSSAQAIEELRQKQSQIGTIVSMIEEIASQTNLLALNAAIEAARAGEQGKGFAVVADEVRKLAERSTHATQEIAQLISFIQADLTVAVESMEASSQEVVEGTKYGAAAQSALSEIVNAIEEVLRFSEESGNLVQSMAQKAEQVGASVQTVASTSDETAAGSQQMSATTQEILATSTQVNEIVRGQTTLVNNVKGMASDLAEGAEQLTQLVSAFKIEDPSGPASYKRAA